ncbi:hypothetical protein GNY06_00165 [Elizabethkingia argentiflava]|uniref:Uncharacterized protein n=1 Tax=Elizabethkingia argenteiflava TaxID=2681556 RepID=A0A845PP63_9FLAO|nr:hypothetical protein [Elizabethkingia argenteiflava]NAW49882.1 hypothetical protein [Elizabethkingia argenteiflava]
MRKIITSLNDPYTGNLAQQLQDHYSSLLDGLIAKGTGAFTFGSDKTDRYSDNALKKIKLPETIYWEQENRKDSTFHSYDVITNLEPETSAVTLERIKDLVLNAYSYPGFKLGKVSNVVNGGSKLVFGSVVDAKAPSTYLVPGGLIEQQAITGGIMNITNPHHTFYKGTTSWVFFKYKNHFFVTTHGEGINM